MSALLDKLKKNSTIKETEILSKEQQVNQKIMSLDSLTKEAADLKIQYEIFLHNE